VSLLVRSSVMSRILVPVTKVKHHTGSGKDDSCTDGTDANDSNVEDVIDIDYTSDDFESKHSDAVQSTASDVPVASTSTASDASNTWTTDTDSYCSDHQKMLGLKSVSCCVSSESDFECYIVT